MRLRKQGQIDAKFTKRFVVAFGVVTYLVELAAADRDAPATATAPPPNAVRFRRRRPTSASSTAAPGAATFGLRLHHAHHDADAQGGRRARRAAGRGELVEARHLVLQPPPAVSALVLAGRRCSSPLPASLPASRRASLTAGRWTGGGRYFIYRPPPRCLGPSDA